MAEFWFSNFRSLNLTLKWLVLRLLVLLRGRNFEFDNFLCAC